MTVPASVRLGPHSCPVPSATHQGMDENVCGCARETKVQWVKGLSHKHEDLSVGHQNLIKSVVEAESADPVLLQ